MSDSISLPRVDSSWDNDDTQADPESGLQRGRDQAVDTGDPSDFDEPRAGTPDTKRRNTNKFGLFLLQCCGVNPAHLNELAERRWYYSLGASVILTSMMAGASAAVLASISFADLTGKQVAGIAAAWAIAVFIIDSLIVSRIIGKPTFWNKAGLFVSRFVLAVTVALLMAVGVELAVFGPEIEQKIAQINVADQQKIEDQARKEANAEFAVQLAAPRLHAEFLKNAVAEAQETVKGADRRLKCESDPIPGCESGTGDAGYGDEAKDASAAVSAAVDRENAATQARDDYTLVTRPTALSDEVLATCGLPAGAQITSQQEGGCVAQQLVEDRVQQFAKSAATNTDGMLRRISALSALGQGEHWLSVWGARILLAIAVLSIDLIPLSAKMFGGSTGHDMRARRDFIEASNEYNKAANSASRLEPHFLNGNPGGFHLFGAIGTGYRHHAAVAREKYYKDLFEYQTKVEQKSWSGVKWNDDGSFEFVEAHPDVVESQTPIHVAESQRSEAEPQQPVASGYVAPFTAPEARLRVNDVLTTREDIETKKTITYVLNKKVVTNNRHYELWECTRPDQPNANFLAKCCYKDSDPGAAKGLKTDLVAADVDSPQVIKIDSGKSVQRDTRTGVAFIVMPYYPHGDLAKYIRKEAKDSPKQPVSLPTALHVTRQILMGLADAHERGLIHCDIKPQNILLDLSAGTNRPAVVITDFGISKLMLDDSYDVTLTFSGSRPFSPIEQVVPASKFGRRQSTTDLWAVGAVLFKMLVNESPRHQAEEAKLDLPRTNGILDAQTAEYRTWLTTKLPVAPRLDTFGTSFPRPIADLVAKWLSNEPSDRVSPGIDITRLNSRAVMEDALEQLDAAMAISR